ncbi:MAG: hypothetical protein WAK48_19370 [Candidatus Acidiferrum sp.]
MRDGAQPGRIDTCADGTPGEDLGGYLQVDEQTHSELLAEDYCAVHPDGTVRIGKPSTKEIAAAPIEDYWLRDLEAWPAGEEGAMLTSEVERGLSANSLRSGGKFTWSMTAMGSTDMIMGRC